MDPLQQHSRSEVMEDIGRTPLRLEDLQAAHFSWKFTEALNAARSGDLDLAFLMCEEMRLHPDIDDFRKAMATLFLALASTDDIPKAMTLAEETLNILDKIQIGHCGYCEHGISEMGMLASGHMLDLQREEQTSKLVLHLEMDKLKLWDQGQQNTCEVSSKKRKEKAAMAVRQMEIVLNPEYQSTNGPQGGRVLVTLQEWAEASSNGQDIDSDMMDWD